MTPDESITEFLDAIEYANQERAMIAVRLLCERWPAVKPWLKMSPPLMIRAAMIFVNIETQQRLVRDYDKICAKVAELQKRLDDPVPEYARLTPGRKAGKNAKEKE